MEQLSLNFMAAVTIFSDFGARENKLCHCFIVSPSVCHEVMGPDAMILVFRIIKTFLRTQFYLEGSMEEVSHFQERNGVSFVFVQFFPSFLFFPKEKTKNYKFIYKYDHYFKIKLLAEEQNNHYKVFKCHLLELIW